MQETPIQLSTDDGETLEGRILRGSGSGKERVVICHPHPQYGGTMDNNVVLAARDAFSACGYETLRFNFRGVGRSTGRFDNGRGEALDVAAACAFFDATTGKREPHLAAYSFGSVAALRAIADGLCVASAVLMSPPVSFVDFTGLTLPQKPCTIIVGDGDQYCNLTDLDGWTEAQPDRRDQLVRIVLDDTDHFYWGSESELKRVLTESCRID